MNFAQMIFENNKGRYSQTAIVDSKGKRDTSWGELYVNASRVAAFASEKGLKGVVPVKMERSMEVAATFLGFSLAGIGTTPVADSTPDERCTNIEKQTGNACWTMDDYRQAMEMTVTGFDPVAYPENEPAYVVFTSGSTGEPKGVMLGNDVMKKSIKRCASHEYMGYCREDLSLQGASITFIALIVDLYAPLYGGSTVHILPEEARKDAALFEKYINMTGITKAVITPQLWKQLGEMKSLKRVVTGSDVVSNMYSESYSMINAYGMSESCGLITAYEIPGKMAKTPLGTPHEDVTFHIVDGEMCISGAIAMGYYGRPDLTAEAFTENPFDDGPGHEVLFHSGDMVELLEDGNYSFLGRKDHMIKISGQRVEPDETAAVLAKIDGVSSAVAKGFTREEGRSYLCAYYVSDEPLDENEIRTEMSRSLPSYMMPAFIIRLDEMPLNPNGKINRKVLPEPVLDSRQAEYVAPETDGEKAICRAFEQVLGVEKIGTEDDFFILGGDSIGAMGIVKAAGIAGLSVTDILSGRTPGKIAAAISGSVAGIYENLTENPTRVPLTESQQGIYLECMAGSTVKYNIPMHMVLKYAGSAGPEGIAGGKSSAPDPESVKAAIDKVIKLHPALYAHLASDEEEICMIRTPFPEGGICHGETGDAKSAEAAAETFVEAFDLEKGPLCRAKAIITEDALHIFLDMHHVVSDGTSFSIVAGQILDALGGKEPEAETIDAFNLREIEDRCMKREEYKASEEYFEGLLGGIETDSNLIPDMKPEPGSMTTCRRKVFGFDASITDNIQKQGITESTFFMGVLGYTLAKMTGQKDSLFAAVENGRRSALFDGTVSMMVRTIPVYMEIDEEKPAGEMLEKLQDQFFDSVKNSDVSFGTLARKYGIKSEVLFVYQDKMISEIGGEAGRVETKPLETGEAFANISMSVNRTPEGYSITLDYRDGLYEPETIERFVHIYSGAARAFGEGVPLTEISLIREKDAELYDSFNDNSLEWNDGRTFVDIFRENAKRLGNKTVITSEGNRYTYSQVDEMTDNLAAYLSSESIGTGDVVSVLVPRCEYMPIASYGILKAGAMYEPLDPTYPQERLEFMIEDAGAKLLIADRSLVSLVPGYKGQVLFTDEIPKLDRGKTLPEPPSLEDRFVILYTSGTTGKPKGCLINHGNIMAFCRAYDALAHFDEDSIASVYTSYGFDANIGDLYPAVIKGGSLNIISDSIRLDLPALKNHCEKSGITHMIMTTQVGRQFATEYPEVKHLRSLCCGGEKLVSFQPDLSYRFMNGYGPSESVVMVTSMEVDRFYENIPIGTMLPNCHGYIVDGQNRHVPIGVPGELVVSGPQVSDGYLNRPDKTAEAFVPNTFEKNPDDDHLRCYRTGDIVRWLEDGNIEFIGRRDKQVKIRGFRIELTEVEQVIREFEGIKDATVIDRDVPGGKEIHAYIVAHEEINIDDLKAFIRETKPAYMVPAQIMQIEAIPLTPNFKVDKRKLPVIESTSSNSDADSGRSMTALEEKLCGIVSEITGRNACSVEADFADLGITSITSIKLAVQIYKNFGLHITSEDILNGGTVLKVENMIVAALMSGAFQSGGEKEKIVLDRYALSQTQLGIYAECLGGAMDAYNIPVLLRLPEDIDEGRLAKAIETAVDAHPSLKCFIHADENGDMAMYPQTEMAFEVERETADSMPPAATKFEFAEKPLFRFRLISCGDDRYLYGEFHHIIFDGESTRILFDDISDAYGGGKPEQETFTVWEHAAEESKARNGDRLMEARSYYDSVFRGISADYLPHSDRDGEMSTGMHQQEMTLSVDLVKEACSRFDVTENILFTGAFAFALGKYTAHEDALFATIHNGRQDPRTEKMTGMLVKTLPVYIQTPAEQKVSDYLAGVGQHVRLLRKNDIFSFADAAREFGINGSILFIYQGRMMESVSLAGHDMVPEPDKADSPKAELCMEVLLSDEGYKLRMEYNGGRYSPEWIESFADAYDTAVKNLIRKDTLGEVEIISPAGLARFEEFNNTSWPVEYRPAYRLLEESADRNPDRTAVIDASGQITFRQFDNMANFLAHQLIDAGIAPGSVVEIMVNRTMEIYIAQSGILKAGCAFMCMSPDYPDDRIKFTSGDAEIRAVVTTREVAGKRGELLKSLGVPVMYADDIDTDVKADRLGIDVKPDDRAYLIYTSGSTGTPKGVVVMQKNLVTFADLNSRNPQLEASVQGDPVIGAVTAYTFDASVLEGFTNLANGATLCIAGEDEIHNPIAYTEMCRRHRITAMCSTPSFVLSMLEYEGFREHVKSMKTILVGGEAFPRSMLELLRELNPDLNIINSYGPSECTISCTSRFLEVGEKITIGRPITNTEVYMMDKQNHILPMGALGEMVIIGDLVGAGYLNRPEKTEEVFFTFNGKPAYRSGDLSLISHTGEIEYHGRIDNQVKLRGLRVELGEIETAIGACNGVKNCIVTVHGDENSRFLAAYYTCDGDVTPEDITFEISRSLAEYMVPRIIIRLDSMPMTANGKIDKKALPAPEVHQEKKAYVAPSTESERILCDAFAKTLKVQQVGIDDNFFELGGTSLTATKIAMVAMSHNLTLVYGDIFKYPTVRQLAALSGETDVEEVMINVTSGGEFDYASADKALEANVWKRGDSVARGAETKPGLGTVLLTGATGFLGIHMLREILKRGDGNIYCLIRKGQFTSSELKLQNLFYYYFENSIEDIIGRRIYCVDGDITDKGSLEEIKNLGIDTVVNCAACVKHFADSDVLEKVNVEGVQNLVDWCMETGSRLVHISTISVGGEGIDGKPPADRRMFESELHFGQILENQYILTKFKAERLILDAVPGGLRAKIMRAGNLMPRRSDGEFQINYLTNGFMRRLRGYYALGCIPCSDLSSELEFSPIDETAAAMYTLAMTDDRFTVFHANNTHRVFMSDVIRVMNDAGLKVEPVSDEAFMEKMKEALTDTEKNQAVSGLIAYTNRGEYTTRYMIGYDNVFTSNVLNHMGGGWQITDDAYIRMSILLLKENGFFDFRM